MDWKNLILKVRFFRWIYHVSKEFVIPGFEGMPLYDVTKFFIKGLNESSITMRASSIAFSFFLAIFPTIIFFFTLIPYVPIDNFQEVLLESLKQILPQKTYDASITTLEDIITRPRSGLLSVGFVLALYFSVNGVSSLIDAFNDTYHVIKSRSWLKQMGISLFLLMVISFMIFIAISMIIVANGLIDYMAEQGWFGNEYIIYLLKFFRWIIFVAIAFFGISFMYYYAPSKRTRYRFISAGSSLATLLSLLASVGFNYYANNIATYNVLYGSIGTQLLVMVWIYFNAIILLIGFELNASIYSAKEEGLSLRAD